MDKSEFLSRFHHARNVGSEPDYPLKKKGRSAAVLIPLVDRGSELSLLLTERAHHLRHHPGQISFPGGKVEEDDKTLWDAAVREANEEIGLTPQQLTPVGQLTEYRTVTRYEIVPLIAFVEPPIELVTDENEVASVFEAPISEVCNPASQLVYPVNRGGKSWPIYFIPYQKYMIWGATAAIIRNLSHHLYDIQI
jgi:8-oxo-dGTP pyrophosphatase MutT (NUDIX family)